MDVHNICLVVAVFSLSVSSVVIWLSFVKHNGDSSARHERDIHFILRALQTSQKSTTNTTNHETILQFLSSYNQSQKQDSNLGNYFTGGYFIHRGKYHREYSHSPLTILPFFHDNHGDFEKCLLKTALEHKQAVSPKMTLWNRLKWDTSSEGVFKFKHKFKVHYGQASFGMCDVKSATESSKGIKADGIYGVLKDSLVFNHDSSLSEMAASYLSKCGHAFIMQDPISLAISDLGECLLDPRRTSQCQLLHHNTTTVEEWIEARGSIVFRHFLFTSDICQNNTDFPNMVHKVFSDQNSSSGIHLSPQDLCESNHNRFVNSLTPDVIERLVSFITGSIQNLFSVVGIFEDFGNSLTLLNHVFRLPLHECEFVSKFRDTSPTRKFKLSHRMRHAPPKDRSTSDMKLDLFQSTYYRNMPSSPRLLVEKQDEATLFDTLAHIESELIWDKGIRTTTTSVPSISESYQTSDSIFDYDVVDFGMREIGDQQFSHLKDIVDSNETNFEKDPRIHPVNDSRINLDLLQDSRNHFEDLISSRRSIQIDTDEENDEEEDNDSLEKVISENTISSRSIQLKTDAVLNRLYNRFLNSESIMRSLAPDLRIYDAVKKLYTAQKQLFFNSL